MAARRATKALRRRVHAETAGTKSPGQDRRGQRVGGGAGTQGRTHLGEVILVATARGLAGGDAPQPPVHS